MAKGIASGFPFSALGASAALMAKWPVGSHGGTYGGNAIGCAAALATIEVMTEAGFMESVNARGEELREGLRQLMREHSAIVDVRGLGLMNALELAEPARVAAVTAHCRDEGHLLLMNAGTYATTLRLMPPLVVTADEVRLALDAIGAALKATE
jgi:4-aminobutyrate aminotransferase-like enzyme